MIHQFEIINGNFDKNKPYFTIREQLAIPNYPSKYKWYLEARLYNPVENMYEYFLLLSDHKFDEQAHKCRKDDYGRLLLNLHNGFKTYVINELKSRKNLEIEYIETRDGYDIHKIY